MSKIAGFRTLSLLTGYFSWSEYMLLKVFSKLFIRLFNFFFCSGVMHPFCRQVSPSLSKLERVVFRKSLFPWLRLLLSVGRHSLALSKALNAYRKLSILR